MSSDPIEVLRLAAANAAFALRNCVNAGQIGVGYRAVADDLDAALASLSAPPRPEASAPPAEAQAQGSGEVSRFTPSDADRHRCYNCGLRIADHVPDEDGARCKREAVRQLREITAPPSAPVGVGDAEAVLDVFRRAGMHIESGATFSVRGQIAQLLNGTAALAQQPAAKPKVRVELIGKDAVKHQQPAAVDEAMVERAMRATGWLIANPETMRAALVAALAGQQQGGTPE